MVAMVFSLRFADVINTATDSFESLFIKTPQTFRLNFSTYRQRKTTLAKEFVHQGLGTEHHLMFHVAKLLQLFRVKQPRQQGEQCSCNCYS